MEVGLKKAAKEIEKSKDMRLVSHLDADGISAAAVALSAFSRLGKKIHLSIEKQIKPGIIEKLKKEDHGLFVFTDLGSGQLELLEELKKETGKKIIVLDHHLPSSKERIDGIIHINPCLHGKSGDEISGAGVTYLLAKQIDPNNKDLAYLAVIGAIGDVQEDNWVLKGQNKKLLKEAIKEGKIKKEKGLRLFGRTSRPIHKALEYSTDPYIPGITGEESAAVQFLSGLGIDLKARGEWRNLDGLSKEEMKKLASAIICERIRGEEASPGEIFGDVYTLKLDGHPVDAREMSTTLNACGRMAQASIGVLYSLGLGSVFDRVEGVLSGYKKMITKYIGWVKENKDKIRESDNAYYIIADNQIHENFIGTITSICEKSIFEKEKVVFGLALTNEGEIKVSARSPDKLVEKGLNLEKLFKNLPEKIGYGGGHAGAGGAYIDKEKMEEFINMCENYLKEVL